MRLLKMEYLPATVFIKNRSKLKKLLMPSSAVILSSNRAMPRNADQMFPFRQSSDMYYLTGIRQEQCTLVMFAEPSAGGFREILYIPESDRKTAIWDGPRISPEEAGDVSGIREVKYTSYLGQDLREILSGSKSVYFGTPRQDKNHLFPSNEQEIRSLLEPQLMHIAEHQLSPLMTRIRMVKEPEEIEMIKKAISITGQAFMHALKHLRPGVREYELAAQLSWIFQSNGACDHAFDPIVASGRNALVLHYIQNKDVCHDGELLLMDFGAEWRYYASDISRTVPVNGRFNPRQRKLYDATLKVLQQAMQLMQPGQTIGKINEAVGELWEEEHLKLGLYSPRDVKHQPPGAPLWKKYYWHGTSHSIGIDVHDCFDKSVPLKPGMVLSCEPGIYVEEEGTGIRIENDVLVTEKGPVNLSGDIPVEPGSLEDLINRS